MNDLLKQKVDQFMSDVKAVTTPVITRDQFKKAGGLTDQATDRWYQWLVNTFNRFAIKTPETMAMFIAQVGHESTNFTRLSESLNYSVEGALLTFPTRITKEQANKYARRAGEPALPAARQASIANIVYGGRMGNTGPNDGWLYRGRGLIQLTGKNNYRACGDVLGIDLVANPDLVATDEVAMLSAGWFWGANNLSSKGGDVVAATKIINGGNNGLVDRTQRYNVAIKALK